jgi:ELWxxDGT repeat protein
VASDGVHGNELWRSSGSAVGTSLVANIGIGIHPLASGASVVPEGVIMNPIPHLVNVNGTLFFAANDGTHGAELWQSNGTAAGTVMVADINPGAAGSYPFNLTNANGTLLFSANDGFHSFQPWTFGPLPGPGHASAVAEIEIPPTLALGATPGFAERITLSTIAEPLPVARLDVTSNSALITPAITAATPDVGSRDAKSSPRTSSPQDWVVHLPAEDFSFLDETWGWSSSRGRQSRHRR